MCGHDGLRVRGDVLAAAGLLQANYQANVASSRPAQGGVRGRADRPNQVWQLDFTEFETTTGGRRGCRCRDYWSKYELGWHVSPTANQHDAITAIELAPPKPHGWPSSRCTSLPHATLTTTSSR